MCRVIEIVLDKCRYRKLVVNLKQLFCICRRFLEILLGNCLEISEIVACLVRLEIAFNAAELILDDSETFRYESAGVSRSAILVVTPDRIVNVYPALENILCS